MLGRLNMTVYYATLHFTDRSSQQARQNSLFVGNGQMLTRKLTCMMMRCNWLGIIYFLSSWPSFSSGRGTINLPFTQQLRRLWAMQMVQKTACGSRTAWTLHSQTLHLTPLFSRWRLAPLWIHQFLPCLHMYTWIIPVLFPYYVQIQEVPIILKIMPT